MQRLYGEKVRFTVIAPRRPLFRRLGLPGRRARRWTRWRRGALWTRYGLPAR